MHNTQARVDMHILVHLLPTFYIVDSHKGPLNADRWGHDATAAQPDHVNADDSRNPVCIQLALNEGVYTTFCVNNNEEEASWASCAASEFTQM